MKRIVSVLLVLTLVFALSACKKENSTSSESDIDTESVVSSIDTATQNITNSNNEIENDSSLIATSSEKTTSSKPTIASNPTTSSKPIVSSQPTASSKPSHIHSYSKATCTEPKKCSCGATEGSILGHNFKDGKCTVCSTKDPNYKTYDAYINGVGYNIGSEITIDVILKTSDKNVAVCPCLLFYKKTDDILKKYDIASGLEDIFGEEPTLSSTSGEALESEDGDECYGVWRWFQTDFADTDIDFSNGQVLIRLKYTVNIKGNFELRVRDGAYDWQNNNKYTNSLSIKIY